MAPNTTTWRCGAHTVGKHLVLRHYLERWLPIVGSRNSKILIVDGFAGPGIYKGGEDGSPVIAMTTLVDHSASISANVVFLFIEAKKARCEHLNGIVDGWRPRLPDRTEAHVIEGDFSSFLSDQLDTLEEGNTIMAPAFVMIDPFGIKGSEMAMIRRILEHPKCEVFSTFMWRFIRRFLERPEFDRALTAFFGTTEWKACLDLEGADRRAYLLNLYRQRLKQAGAKYVLNFNLRDRRGHVYSIFFATRHLLGSDKMKEAVWKVMPDGGYDFHGGHDKQMILSGIVESPTTLLREALIKEFGNLRWISVADIRKYVSSDRTPFFSGQIKAALRAIESDRGLEVKQGTRRQQMSYPEECVIRFLPDSPTLFSDFQQ